MRSRRTASHTRRGLTLTDPISFIAPVSSTLAGVFSEFNAAQEPATSSTPPGNPPYSYLRIDDSTSTTTVLCMRGVKCKKALGQGVLQVAETGRFLLRITRWPYHTKILIQSYRVAKMTYR